MGYQVLGTSVIINDLLSAFANRMASNSGLGSPSAKSDVDVHTQALSLPQLGFNSISGWTVKKSEEQIRCVFDDIR